MCSDHIDPTIGVLMLDANFQRFTGDIGVPDSLPFSVLYETIPGATSCKATTGGLESVQPFIDAGKRLISRGAKAITTSCGFLVQYQSALTDTLEVPVVTSALVQIPMIRAAIPPRRPIGVLTFNAETLDATYLQAATAPPDTVVVGLPPESAFRRDVLGGETSTSAQREAETIALLEHLFARCPDVGAIVLECTNMAPYAPRLRRLSDLPVFDVLTVTAWLADGLRR